jgi:starch-binding outer membrane protein, SusD/RagB family
MKKNITKYVLALVISMFSISSCTNLDLEPLYVETSESTYADFNNYKRVLAKLYAGFALTGQQGPAGRGDIGGIDEGFSNYVRTYWKMQELPTDEAIIGWNDAGLPELNFMTWSADNPWSRAMYYRIFYQIALANEFIRETSDARLADRGITGDNAETARLYRTEARTLRALSYWHALDLYGSVPFVTENDPIGSFFPEQISRANLFSYVEQELLAVESELRAPRSNEYGRVDQAVAWTILAKLYLNAEVYIGQAKYAEALEYAGRVINAGFGLEPNYNKLFMTDNDQTNEVIFAITADGVRSQSFGLTTFLVNASIGGSMAPASFGVAGGWAGLRTTRNMVNLFPGFPTTQDTRASFYTDGQQLEIDEIGTFTHGYALIKFRNVSSTGQPGSDPSGTHADTDYPMFRLADVYLMYAEAVLRGGGNAALALDYVNQIRQRAGAANITQAQMTLDFILDERGRELKWEAQRRTDLIRFNRFTGENYLWPWKGGARDGRGVNARYNLYPIPNSDLVANPNLTRTPGY